MSCTVCNHPQRQAIDLALLNRTATLAQLSRQHHLSQSALHRHKQHLLKKMAHTQNRFQNMLREGCLVILYSFLEHIIRLIQHCRAAGNTRQVLQAVRQGTAIIKFMHKLDLNLDLETVYRLLDSPQSVDQDSLLPTDLKFIAGSRQSLADSLFASCPEPASDQEQALEAAAAADLAVWTRSCSKTSSPTCPSPWASPNSPRLLASGKKAGKKRKKAHGSNANSKRYQEDSSCEKNAAKFPRAEN